MTTSQASDYSWVTLSFRAFGRDARIVHDAAARKGQSAASYMRTLILSWAYADTQRGEPDLSGYAGQDVVAEAAKAAGLTVREFTNRSARAAAVRDLEARIGRPMDREVTRGSGTRKAAGR